jgi:hypothetical protein
MDGRQRRRPLPLGLHSVPRYRLIVKAESAGVALNRLLKEPVMSLVVPDACTLPTVEQPLRLAEFDALFAAAVHQVDLVTPSHTRLRLTGDAGLAAAVRDRIARETECCSFFTFTVTPEPAGDGAALTLDIEVPAPYTDVLAALTQRASTVSAGRTS